MAKPVMRRVVRFSTKYLTNDSRRRISRSLYQRMQLLSEGKILLSPVENMDDPRECSLGWIDTVGIGHEINKDAWRNTKEIKII